MTLLLERYNLFFWIVTLTGAISIFYLSSLTFESVGVGFSINSIIYHISAFFLFSLFLFFSLTKGKEHGLIFLGIIVAFTYGVTDEIHQFFVPGRALAAFDVFLDSIGILFASMIYSVYYLLKKD